MFIVGSKEEGFHIHLNALDMEDLVVAGENIGVTLSADKAKELEDRLEVSLKGT